jgi:HSP20 family molecular chaperone IbpA
MSRVAVERVKEPGTEPSSVIARLETMAGRIRQRAYEIFEKRGTDGHSVDDWLEAERDLVLTSEPEVSEKDGKYDIRLTLQGFKANETHVTVLPDAVIVCAEAGRKHEENTGEAQVQEFASKMLYRRFDLSAPINVDKVAANLDGGTLHITAQKSHAAARTANAA